MSQPAPAGVTPVEGIISLASAFPVAETVARIQQALTSKGLTLFAVIDHSGEARRIGLALRNTKLLIFGSPRAGTPLMDAAPLLALDLPLKALVWEDDTSQTWVSYLNPAWLAERHHIPADLSPNIAGIEPLITSAIQP